MSRRFVSVRSLKVVEGLTKAALEEMQRDHGLVIYRVPAGSDGLIEESNLFDAIASICNVKKPRPRSKSKREAA